MEVGFNYNLANITDCLFLIAELEHMRRHAILAAINAPDEEAFQLQVLAKQCQDARRNFMKKHFKVENRHWCMVKSASRLLQISEEISDGDLDETKELKGIVDSAIGIATGEDISDCESCRKDSEKSP